LNSPGQRVLFPDLFSKPVQAVFDEPNGTSDGGALLVKAADRKLALTEALAGCLLDPRRPDRVRHSVHDLLRQRIYGLALGYEDANDVARIGSDPMHRLLLDRDPLSGDPLASQPTLSRFETSVDRRTAFRLSRRFAEVQLRRMRRRRKNKPPRRITIDLDPTDDATHGNQQLTFFSGHYDSWCYLPLLGFVTLDDEPESHLVAAVLRPGNAGASAGATGVLKRLIRKIRDVFPRTRIRVRLDGGFAGPNMLDFLEAAKVEYVVGLPKNSRLQQGSGALQGNARAFCERNGYPLPFFGEMRYAAKSWKEAKRRVVFKAEVTLLENREPKDNPRYVVTNLRHTPENVYAIYCKRGEIENRIKEIKDGVALGRTSCTGFWANQLRVILAAVAYVLLQEVRGRLSRTVLARAQVNRLRLCLLKIGARIECSARRVVVHLAAAHGWQPPWARVAVALGATRI